MRGARHGRALAPIVVLLCAGWINGATPVPTVTITTTPSGTTPPGQQPKVSVSIASAYATDLTGTLMVSFATSGGSDNPEVRFAASNTSSQRMETFTIPATKTQAQFGAATTATIIGGTVGGTITITLTQLVDANANDVTPSPAPTGTLVVNTTPPVITSVTITTTPGTGFSVNVTGYSTPRDMSAATFHFVPTSGTTLNAADFTVQVGSAFTAWYANSASLPYGSQFTLTVPFSVQGSTFPIAAATVTLTNSKGTSATSPPANP